jgi:hypothetical protein
MVPEAFEEHHVVKLVLDELPDVDPEDDRFQAKMTVLSELIDHHVEEEEKEMFKAAERLGAGRLEELGSQMEASAEGTDADALDEYEDDDEDETEDDDADDFEVDDEADNEQAEEMDRPKRRAR